MAEQETHCPCCGQALDQYNHLFTISDISHFEQHSTIVFEHANGSHVTYYLKNPHAVVRTFEEGQRYILNIHPE